MHAYNRSSISHVPSRKYCPDHNQRVDRPKLYTGHFCNWWSLLISISSSVCVTPPPSTSPPPGDRMEGAIHHMYQKLTWIMKVFDAFAADIWSILVWVKNAQSMEPNKCLRSTNSEYHHLVFNSLSYVKFLMNSQ